MPLIEVDHLDAKALRTLDLVLFSLANPPLPMIAAYEGVVILDDPWEPARGFIDSFETKVRRASDLSSSLTALATVRDAFLTGAVAYGVDANTGRTIICVMSEDGVSPVFSVDMPKPRDMRSAPGYVALSASGGFFS